MKEKLLEIMDQLSPEDLRLLYITALELLKASTFLNKQ